MRLRSLTFGVDFLFTFAAAVLSATFLEVVAFLAGAFVAALDVEALVVFAALLVFLAADFFEVFDVALVDFLVVAMRHTIAYLYLIASYDSRLEPRYTKDMSEIATFGGGCFWCLDAFYRRINGVETVVSGYAGGHLENPSYDDVCSGTTGHAEVIQVTYDPNQITFWELLEIFFTMHDPTTPNRQGNDVGDQYRSIILYHNEEQERIAKQVISEFANSHWDDPVVTQVEPLEHFYPAEDYHQDYFNKNPTQGYCVMIINPKIQKLRQEFAAKLKP